MAGELLNGLLLVVGQRITVVLEWLDILCFTARLAGLVGWLTFLRQNERRSTGRELIVLGDIEQSLVTGCCHLRGCFLVLLRSG